jgi:hypothetical protein
MLSRNKDEAGDVMMWERLVIGDDDVRYMDAQEEFRDSGNGSNEKVVA